MLSLCMPCLLWLFPGRRRSPWPPYQRLESVPSVPSLSCHSVTYMHSGARPVAAATSGAKLCHLCATRSRPSRSNTAWRLRWPPTPRSFATRCGLLLFRRARPLHLRPISFSRRLRRQYPHHIRRCRRRRRHGRRGCTGRQLPHHGRRCHRCRRCRRCRRHWSLDMHTRLNSRSRQASLATRRATGCWCSWSSPSLWSWCT